jgi:hypothetical protein
MKDESADTEKGRHGDVLSRGHPSYVGAKLVTLNVPVSPCLPVSVSDMELPTRYRRWF